MRNSSVNGIEDIYNVINRIVIEKEPTPPNRSEWLPQVAEMEEQPYDTLENVVNSMHKEPLFMVPPPSSSVTTTTSQNTEGGGAGRNAATKPEESLVRNLYPSCDYLNFQPMTFGSTVERTLQIKHTSL